MIASDPAVEVWAIPAKTGGSRAFCDRMNAWAQGEGPAGSRLHLLARGERGARRRRAARQEHREERTEAVRTQLGLEAGDACFFVAGRRRSSTPSRARRARASARSLNLVDRDRFELAWIIDFPFYEWTRTTRGRLRAQPVLDAQGGMEALQGGERWRSRRSSTTSSATASRSRPAASATSCPR